MLGLGDLSASMSCGILDEAEGQLMCPSFRTQLLQALLKPPDLKPLQGAQFPIEIQPPDAVSPVAATLDRTLNSLS